MSATVQTIVRETIPQSMRADALTWVRRSFATYRHEQKTRAPSLRSQRAQLKKAGNYAKKLRECLDSMPFAIEASLTQRMGELYGHQYCEVLEKLEASV